MLRVDVQAKKMAHQAQVYKSDRLEGCGKLLGEGARDCNRRHEVRVLSKGTSRLPSRIENE